MKNTEIRELEDTDLLQKLKDARAELFNLRFQLATGQLDNTGRIAIVKKDIARLHTELRARELRAQRDAAAS
jgi:large subunit ribosomal protein L29